MGVRRNCLQLTSKITLVTLILTCVPVPLGHAQLARPRSRPMREAVALLRVINDAESHFRANGATYGTWHELSKSGIVRGIVAQSEERATHDGVAATMRPSFNLDSAQPLAGYVFTLYVSADGAHYLCSLRDRGINMCGVSFFTDDSGLIFQAKPIGCK